MRPSRIGSHLLAVLGSLGLSAVITWPLPTALTTRLSGAPGGDTGVYVWNLWLFRHELISHGQLPLWTDHIFALSRGTDLSVHNYTVFADLLGLGLIPWLGVVGAFNAIYLLLIASSAYAMYVLVRRLTGRGLEAWIAGAAFAASPVLVSRGTGHFSLVASAPLPLFLVCLLRTIETRRIRDAVLTGLVIGWSGYCDVYFPMYCALMATIVVVFYRWRVDHTSGDLWTAPVTRSVNALIVLVGLAIGWRLWHGEGDVSVLDATIHVRTLYTPVLLLTAFGACRAYLALRPRWAVRQRWRMRGRTLHLCAAALLTAGVVLSPVLIALGERIADGRFPRTPIYWRSSPAGVDLLTLVLPNPNSAWFGGPSRAWIVGDRPDAFPEMVGSLSLVSILIVALAVWRVPRAVPRLWIAFPVFFMALALGPFVHVARINTYVPGPWALLRYVPIIDLARAPSRFAIIGTLGLSIALGFALVALRRRWPGRGRLILTAATTLLTIELLPAPLPLYEATVPSIYSIIQADADESHRVLELPTGIRDGTSSIGNFSAASQYFQTTHHKPLLGGYLSRVSERRKEAYWRIPVFASLFTLSEGRPVSDELARQALATREQFLADACVRYVVIDQRASDELRTFAIRLFGLMLIGEDLGRELFIVPGAESTQPCRPVPIAM